MRLEEKILDQILKDTYTADSFKRRFQALRMQLSGKLYKGNDQDEIKDDVKSEKNDLEKWLEGFDQSVLEGITSNQFSAMSEHIDKFISNLNPLTIYFVFVPEEKQIEEVGKWLRQNLKNDRLIFNVKIDPALIGGCAIVYNGVYKDYSLKEKISKNKNLLIEEFRKYFKQ